MRLVVCCVFEGSSRSSSRGSAGGFSEPWVPDLLEEVISLSSVTSSVPGGGFLLDIPRLLARSRVSRIEALRSVVQELVFLDSAPALL